ncbi:hypothetical protein PMZ80_008361 [Knufia obscura]|uniref:Uncharacterized protein n=1 Tax=Knufia obscura TaxID=1635080 RepID=A0ABR0REK3_9EURO|nr:hypothetical protein PMZ80_008361 [Knufia obscura]
MAKSLDQLIDFLLEEIALGGEQGILFRDVVDYTNQFYAQPESSPAVLSPTRQTSSTSIDRTFIAKLWRWLSRHQDVSVGQGREYNDLTFQELEARFLGIVDLSASTVSLPSPADGTAQDQTDLQHSVAPQARSDGPRFSVSLERIYLAICGHGPDATKVFPMEYTLLCAIAATRQDGILQGELGRSTGQDKRSVPKRTDALQAKGYIVKRTAWIGGHKTSRLILRRFTERPDPANLHTRAAYTLGDLALQVFSELKESSFTTHDDLASALSMTDPARNRVLTQVVRLLVQRECLKKVKVAKGPGSGTDDLKICIQINREPDESDWQKRDDDTLDLHTSVDDALAIARLELTEVIGDAVEDNDDAPISKLPGSLSSARPSWNPDRLLSNVLFDLAATAGQEGMTNVMARRAITGLSVRRPIESLLVRLSHGSLKAQPPQTRDLSLVRSSEVKDSISRFVHRTVDEYHSLVQQGEADWSALTGGQELAKQLQVSNSEDVMSNIERDEFGFAKRSLPKNQVNYGQGGLEDVASMAKAASLTVKSNEPILVDDIAGNVSLVWKPDGMDDGRSSRSATPIKPLPKPRLPSKLKPPPKEKPSPKPKPPPKEKPPPKPKTPTGESNLGKGRMRKFAEGTDKFWREIFLAKMIRENPSYPKQGAAGLMNDPACIEMFKNRPPDLDAMVVKALEHNVPILISPDTVSQTWVDRMTMFFERTTPGVYFAPSGAQNLSRRQVSCIVVVRTNRLSSVDFSDRTVPAPVLFLASSAAHTHRYYRIDSWIAEWQRKEAEQSFKQPIGPKVVKDKEHAPQPRSKPRLKQMAKPENTTETQPPSTPDPFVERIVPMKIALPRGTAPQKGTFSEFVLPATPLPQVVAADPQTRRPSSSRSIHMEEDSDATASDPEMSNRMLLSGAEKGGRGSIDVQSSRSSAPRSEVADSPVSVWGLPERRWSYNASTEPDAHGTPTSSDDHTSFVTRTVSQSVNKRPLQVTHAHPLLTHNPFRGSSEQRNSTSMRTDSSESPRQGPSLASDGSGLAEKTSPPAPVNDNLGPLHPELFVAPPTESVGPSAEARPPSPKEVPPSPLPRPSLSARASSPAPDRVSQAADGDLLDVSVLKQPAKQEQEAVAVEAADDAIASNAGESAATNVSAITTSASRTTPDPSSGPQIPPRNDAPTDTTLTPVDPAATMFPAHEAEDGMTTLPIEKPKAKSKVTSKASELLAAKTFESRKATKHYQRFILELLKMCGSVLPYGKGGPSMLKRAMKAKCIEAGMDNSPSNKHTKSCVNQLTQGGRAKLMHFAFQKNGLNHTKTVLALPHVLPTDGPFMVMQGKISSMPVEEDYVPPEMEAEADRTPSDVIRRELSSEPEAPAISTPQRKKKQPQPRQRRESFTPNTARAMSLSPPVPEPSPNVGFLTLKVPKIAAIKTQSTFTTKYFELPAEPLQFNTDANAIASQTAEPTPASQRRTGIRIPRNTKFNPQTRKIQWRVPKTTALPKSLKAILSQDRRTDAEAAQEDHALSAFERDVEFVATWEQKKYDDLQEQKPGTWNFINHFTPKNDFTRVPREGELGFRMIQFRGDREDAADHEEIETELPEAISWDVFAQISATTKSKQKKATAASEKRKRKLDDIDGVDGDHQESDFGASEAENPRPKRARRQPKTPRIGKKRKAGTDADARRRKHARLEPRGVGMRHIPKDQAHRLGIVFALVKVLAGGLDRYLDFKLVARLVPEESESVLKERWSVLSTRYNHDVDALIEDVQIKYLDALADDRVPSVNFDNLESTDWEGILAWASANVNTKNKDLFREIPPTREELLTLNKVEVEEPPPLRNLYNASLNYGHGMREEAWCSVVLGTVPKPLPKPDGDSIEPQFTHEDGEKDSALARARSWVIAAILTPELRFNPAYAHQKLLKLADNPRAVDTLLEITMKKLQADRIVIDSRNGESMILPGGSILSGTHGWKVCSKYFDKFESNRYITATMLRGAAKYKLEVLDTAFARGETILLQKEPDVEDGEMMAIFNLVSMGMLQIKPGNDVPASRYGLDWEDQGYKTKSMDKNILSFSTILQPTSTYLGADPVSTTRGSVPIPRGGIDQPDDLGLIPAWFDINLDFQPYIWELLVGAVIGIISVRPGVSSIEIIRTLSWTLSQYDLDLVLQFLRDCTLIQKTYNGWETTEWWWLALGSGYSDGVQWKVANGISEM